MRLFNLRATLIPLSSAEEIYYINPLMFLRGPAKSSHFWLNHTRWEGEAGPYMRGKHVAELGRRSADPMLAQSRIGPLSRGRT